MAEPATGAPIEDRGPSVANASPDDDSSSPRPKTPPLRDGVTTSQYIYSSQNRSTPRKDRGTVMADSSPEEKDKNELQREAALEELGTVHEITMGDAQKIFRSVSSFESIHSYLETSDLYDSEIGRWAEVPEQVPKEKDLYKPFVAIANSILGDFITDTTQGVTRVAVDTSTVQLIHDDPDDHTSPDISVKASGPSFEVPDNASKTKGVGYSDVASIIEVKREENKLNTAKDHAKQVAVYVRQIFIQQPNRNYVRALILTQERCRLLHFDRSGIYVTPLFNIHDMTGRVLLVKYILGLSSTDEAALGLDTSVQWTIGGDGKKEKGIITVLDEKTNLPVIYDLNMDESVLVRPGIRCRGTIGWHAKDRDTGEDVLIKDSWRTDSREPEYVYLEEAASLPGVPQVLRHQDYLFETIDTRSGMWTFRSQNQQEFNNRIKLRLVLVRYGESIWYFRSRLQLLLALRAAVVAHRELVVKMILHRDIAIPNILLGLPGAKEGFEGILVDLDMAIHVFRQDEDVSTEPRSAYRFYQSILSLLTPSDDSGWIPPHSYMDDIEGIFYSLFHIMFHFQKPGVRVQVLPILLQTFRLDNNHLVYNAKFTVIQNVLEVESLSRYWGPHCERLIISFQKVVKDMVSEQQAILKSRDSSATKATKYKKLCADRAKDHYSAIIEAFDAAIEGLNSEGLNKEELEDYPEYPEPYPIYRPVDEDPDAPAADPLSNVDTAELPTFQLPDDMVDLLSFFRSKPKADSLKRRSEDPDLRSGSSKRHHGQSSRRNPADFKNNTLFDDDDDDEPLDED